MADQFDLDGDNNINSVANRLALAAAIIAIAAFVAATLQVLLEYVSSSAARHKCSPSAIDAAAYMVRKSWSFRGWKRKLYYPQISFDVVSFYKAAGDTSKRSIEGIPFLRELVSKNEWEWNFKAIVSEDIVRSYHISDGLTVLVHQKSESDAYSLATVGDLDWRTRVRWMWWKFRNRPLGLRRPRASWAQIMRANGFTDARAISLNEIDADSIPSSIDVAIQRVRLYHLGFLALNMGLTTVKIDPENRFFHASGANATITVEDVPTFGKVLRFEGDTVAIYSEVRLYPLRWIALSNGQINGMFDFGLLRSKGISLPLPLLIEGIAFNWSAEQLKSAIAALGHEVKLGHMPEEAACMKELVSDGIKDQNSIFLGPSRKDSLSVEIKLWKLEKKYGNIQDKLREMVHDKFTTYEESFKSSIGKWQRKFNSRLPSVMVATAFAMLHVVGSGFPSTILLDPFLEIMRILAKDLSENKGVTFTLSAELEKRLAMGELHPLVLEESVLFMGAPVGVSYHGFIGWGTCDLEGSFEALPPSIRHIIAPKGGESRIQGPISILLMPEAYRLLQEFEPRRWHGSGVSTERIIGFGSYRRKNLIWFQILLLDITIRLLIQGCEGEASVPVPDLPEPPIPPEANDSEKLYWDQKCVRILRCIEKSYELRPEGTAAGNDTRDTKNGAPTSPTERDSGEAPMLNWELTEALAAHSGLPYETDAEKLRIQKLGDAIKLRSLFFSAFLMMMADSSDVYVAEDSEVEMPII